MKISQHLEKAAAFERALARFDPLHDSELFIVFLMRAGTNRVNAALHDLHLTTEITGGAEGKIGDLNHTYKPRLAVPLPPGLERAFDRLAFLEGLRPEFVRGGKMLDKTLADACLSAYEEIRERTAPVVRNGNPS